MDAFLHTDQSQAAVSFRLFDIEADPAVLYVKDQAATFQHVLSPGSGKEADGRARLIFHQYGKEYFLATVSHRTSSSTYDCPESKEKKRLADASPNQKLKLVTVFSNGNVSTAGHQESGTPRRAGGLMSWAASKAVGPMVRRRALRAFFAI